jgi:hypothetical protein
LDKRRLAFYEVGKGKLLSEFQALFEQAQIEAAERNAEVICVLKIHVQPPEATDKKFGRVSYETSIRVPARKSMEFTTELVGGVIVDDGDSQADLMQLKLDLQIPSHQNTIPMQKEGTDGK